MNKIPRYEGLRVDICVCMCVHMEHMWGIDLDNARFKLNRDINARPSTDYTSIGGEGYRVKRSYRHLIGQSNAIGFFFNELNI